MLNKIRDIQIALGSNAYLSALALALTLPDICGKVAYPEHDKETRKRFIKWFDEYITEDKYPINYPEDQKLGGEKFYELRCAFLHAGSVKVKTEGISFKLFAMKSQTPGYGMSSCCVTKLNDGTCTFQVTLDVMQICTEICLHAENFYNSYEDKSVFYD